MGDSIIENLAIHIYAVSLEKKDSEKDILCPSHILEEIKIILAAYVIASIVEQTLAEEAWAVCDSNREKMEKLLVERRGY